MPTIPSFLRSTHEQFNSFSSLRINLYLNSHDKNEATILLAAKNINDLINRLATKKYVSGAIWVMAFDDKKGVYIQVVFYLDDSQHDALAIIATGSLWIYLTKKIGTLIELDIESDITDVFVRALSISLFQPQIKEGIHYGIRGGGLIVAII